MNVNTKDRIKYHRMLGRYLKAYGEEYSEREREYIKENFLSDASINPDIMLQIYAKFGMLSQEENFYLGFARLIGQRYGWDATVLEVGGGYFPMFSKYLSDLQKEHNSKGTVTVYDPLLVTSKLGRVTLRKEELTKDISVKEFDLLVGIMPCDATKIILETAIKENKEFFIALCGCMPNDVYTPYYLRQVYYDHWVDGLYELALEQESQGFDVLFEEGQTHNYMYPIISSIRKR